MLRDAETNDAIGEASAEQIEASDINQDTGLIYIDTRDGEVVQAAQRNDPWYRGHVRQAYVESE